jgi:hypothetical protein
MKSIVLVYILCSLMMKVYYEKQRDKNYPVMIAKHIEYGMRVNIRGRNVYGAVDRAG